MIFSEWNDNTRLNGSCGRKVSLDEAERLLTEVAIVVQTNGPR